MSTKKKILLVDDDQIFLTLAELAISKVENDVVIHKASNGEDAMSFLLENQVDVIFLDLNMPIMNGWELLDELTKRGEMDHKVFILTSSIDPADKEKADKNPMVISMVPKPLDSSKVSFALQA